jgi:VWFA-related protein
VRGGGAVNHLREETLAVGTLGAIRFVVNAMSGFPGRKAVVLFTENIRLIYQGTPDEVVANAVQQLSDAASRASVVIHAIDPRGVQDYNPTPADNTSRMSPRRIARLPAQREQQVIYTQEGMSVLAQETGGLFLQGANDVAGALRKAAEDSDGYYLIGYHPDANTFENRNGQPKFHKIEVKVTRTGWHVRSRDGFFGEPTAEYRSRCFGKSRLAHWTNQIRRLVRGGPVKPIPLQAYWAVVARLRKNDP